MSCFAKIPLAGGRGWLNSPRRLSGSKSMHISIAPGKHCQITFQLVALRDQPSPGAGLMLSMAFRITTRCSTAAGRPGLQNPRPRGSRQQGRTCTFLDLGCTRPRPPPRDPNRFGHFRFPSAFFSAVAVVGPLPGE